ncbi:MAG: DUF393 domain-containing protein [Rickettsiales bacterium]|nr:DUF393 domain-containing protein [Rickettsiales bacterium]
MKVFYNKSCKICNAEINHYKKYSNNEIEWIDIINNPKAQKLTSKTYEDLIKKIHIIEDNRVIEGAGAFLLIWKNIPRYNFLYTIFKIPFFFFLLNNVYRFAAFLLFFKNKELLK